MYQWLGDGRASYPLVGLPTMDVENICAMFDITDKKREKLVMRQFDAPDSMNWEDTDSFERRLDNPKLCVRYDGRDLLPLETSAGVTFIQEKYLLPLDGLDYMQLYERKSTSGGLYIAAKIGMILQAVIMPMDLPNELYGRAGRPDAQVPGRYADQGACAKTGRCNGAGAGAAVPSGRGDRGSYRERSGRMKKAITIDCEAGRRAVYEDALNTWGAEAQTKMLFEEIGELMQAVCKADRVKNWEERTKVWHNIAEEIADVSIMLDQMAVLFGVEDGVEKHKREKIARLVKRLEAAHNEKGAEE